MFALAFTFLLIAANRAVAYVEAPYSLGRVLAEATNVITMRVEKIDKQRNVIVYRKVADLKGTYAQEQIKHNIGQAGFSPREWQTIMAWAEVGKLAVFFHNNSSSETCIDNYWYQANAGGEWWQMTHAEPYLLRTYAGRPEKLAPFVAAMQAGQEVIVPCLLDGDKNALQLGTAKVQRVKASLKIQDYNPVRDFAGWGGEDFRVLRGMPGFSHLGGIGRVDPGVRGIATNDLDGDGKPELCLFGDGRTSLLQQTDGLFSEVALPIATAARHGQWADFDGDNQPELLLVTPLGPRLLAFANGQCTDLSARLPLGGYFSLKAGAWIDYDGDGHPDVLLADRFRGLRLWRNVTAKAGAGPAFVDVSADVGLGERGLAGDLFGDSLTVLDFDGDGRLDFYYHAGRGVLAWNTPDGFIADRNRALDLTPGPAPVFGDFDGDKLPDVFVPRGAQSQLLRNAGRGRFIDVTAQAGDVRQAEAGDRCGLWTDFNGDGRPDLLVGCWKSANRYLENNGDGTFTDRSAEVGFRQHVFNTGAIAYLDVNKDGAADLVLNNEGQDSVILLGKKREAEAKRTARQ